ncbi:Crp/Fnr family transcriptional regulator [Labrenzia sp. DG1229]|uniref:Crp/Fnr family transcriptional regulator n=1 Tax=Labrenzia sp. DG1229 TaxID=681847 RepID=UPI00068E52CD|nr:Crp/Fnr family transcriptional regulator [Labrenzia sp. DG1229]
MKISPELRSTLRCHGKVRNLARKTCLLEQGDVSRHAYFVESGSLRLWYNDNGKDVSVKFFLQQELCASLDSFYREQPSRYGLESLASSVVRIYTKQDISNFMERSENFRDSVNSAMVHCMADYQDLFADRISKSPEDRYQALIEQEPEVLNTVPLHYIASYLGITPVSLSRIRRKIENT